MVVLDGIWDGVVSAEVKKVDYGLYVVLGLFVTAMAATSVMFGKMMKE
ncbi:hypothetical protein [Neobacillus niacini]|nr:hypothetical protein [Neobacillus niacini]MDR7000148.1 hypothetical protein [Neobacillus niacini]